MVSKRRPQGAALLFACGAFALVAFLVATNPVRGEAEASGDGRFVEETRYIPRDDGTLVVARAIVDTETTDPDAVMEALAPGGFAADDERMTAQYRTAHKWAPEDMPVGVYYNQNFDPRNTTALFPVQHAMVLWNSIPDHSFRFGFRGLTGAVRLSSSCATHAGDGYNTVRFTASLLPGTVALTCTLLDSTTMIDGYQRAIEFDIMLNGTNYIWSHTDLIIPPYVDMLSVLLHEFGHALGLQHSFEGTVMQPFLGPQELMREFHIDDIAGIRALYPVATPTTPTPSITAIGTPTGTTTPTSTPTGTVTATPTATPTPPLLIGQARLPVLARD